MKDGRWKVTNFGLQLSLELAAHDGKRVAGVSGLSVPFAIPGDLDDEILEQLVSKKILLSDEEYERYDQSILDLIRISLHGSSGLIIMPTEKCNFRCTYCYESFTRGRMSKASADALSLAIHRKASVADSFSLGFFGGEPLLCPDLVTRFSGEAFEISQRRGRPYAAGIATNGYFLDRKLFEQLLDAGVCSYQITIDGDRGVHDRQRLTMHGEKTFDVIARNVLALREVDGAFSCVVRCNVHRGDFERVLELFDGGEFEPLRNDPRFRIDVHEIWASDQKEIQNHPERTEGCSASMGNQLGFFQLTAQLQSLGFNTTASGSLPRVLGRSCYAGKPDWFVVGPNLDLYKCTVVFDNPQNQVGRIDEQGNLVVDDARNDLWTASSALTDAGCRACHLRVPCGGIACPLSRFSNGSKACLDLKTQDNLIRWANGGLSGPATGGGNESVDEVELYQLT